MAILFVKKVCDLKGKLKHQFKMPFLCVAQEV